jgi:hypothetical protein
MLESVMSGPCFTCKRFIIVIVTFDNFKEATSHKQRQKNYQVRITVLEF